MPHPSPPMTSRPTIAAVRAPETGRVQAVLPSCRPISSRSSRWPSSTGSPTARSPSDCAAARNGQVAHASGLPESAHGTRGAEMSTTIMRHPDAATLMSFAAGSLAEPLAAVVAAHVAMCAACRADVADLELLGAALLADASARRGRCGDRSCPATADRPRGRRAAAHVDPPGKLPAPLASRYKLSFDTHSLEAPRSRRLASSPAAVAGGRWRSAPAEDRAGPQDAGARPRRRRADARARWRLQRRDRRLSPGRHAGYRRDDRAHAGRGQGDGLHLPDRQRAAGAVQGPRRPAACSPGPACEPAGSRRMSRSVGERPG